MWFVVHVGGACGLLSSKGCALEDDPFVVCCVCRTGLGTLLLVVRPAMDAAGAFMMVALWVSRLLVRSEA